MENRGTDKKSESHRKAVSESHKGMKKPWAGKYKHHPHQGFQKGNNFGNFEEGHKKIGGFVKGDKHSEKSKKIITIKAKNNWQNKEYVEKTVKAILKGLIKRPTSLEKEMIEIINKHGLPYKYCGDGSFLIGYKNPDFVNTNGQKTCIEVYYDFFKIRDFNSCSKYEKQRKEHFKRFGWYCMFFRVSEGNKLDEKKVLEVLQ